MPKWTRISMVFLAALLLFAAVAPAKIFTITLTNGTTFESRYRPQEVDWDDSIVIVQTDRGNPIALLKEEVADVSSEAELRGFGYQVDTTTIYLGFSPNDLVSEDAEGNPVTEYELPDAPSASAPNYSLGQFVNAPVAGGVDSLGIPLYVTSED